MKKGNLLILTYYWPPSGGAGVQRWLYMSKYLRDMGWDITICTSANPDYPHVDQTLHEFVHPNIKVLKVKSFEPRNLITSISGDKQNLDRSLDNPKKQSFLQKMMVWVRGNLFIPDARVNWARQVEKKLPKLLKDNDLPDIIVSTGPPHSTHLAALKLKKKFQAKWIADFRDPWLQIEYFDKLKLTDFARKKHEYLEDKVLKSADHITTVSPSWADFFHDKANGKVSVIYNGFYHEDVTFTKPIKTSDKFFITHAGTMGDDRVNHLFFEALAELCAERNDFRKDLNINFLGNIDAEFKQYLREIGIWDNGVFAGLVNHDLALSIMRNSDILLLIQNRVAVNLPGRIPMKYFEYLGMGRPIFIVGSKDSDLAKISKSFDHHYAFDFEEKEKMKNAVNDLYKAHKSGAIGHVENSRAANQFTRQTASLQFDKLCLSLMKTK